MLDASCGSGGLGAAIVRALPSGSQMTHLERNQGRLDEARALFAAEGLEAEFVLGDFGEFDLAERTFDAVWCSHALHAHDKPGRPTPQPWGSQTKGSVQDSIFDSPLPPSCRFAECGGWLSMGLARQRIRWSGRTS